MKELLRLHRNCLKNGILRKSIYIDGLKWVYEQLNSKEFMFGREDGKLDLHLTSTINV